MSAPYRLDDARVHIGVNQRYPVGVAPLAVHAHASAERTSVPSVSGEFLTAKDTPGRILLVDDNPELLRAQERLLSAAGFVVSCCSDGAQALKLIRHDNFEAVISDIRMPNLDGIQLLRAIHARDPDLPVIIATGAASVTTAIEAVEHGAFSYLVKPVNYTALVDGAKRAVQLQRLAKAKREALTVLGEQDGAQSAAWSGLQANFESAMASLWPAFQPIVRTDGSLFGFEALLRTNEPTMPHPECVIDAALQLGQLNSLGRTMRDLAVTRLRSFPEPWTLLVNLHPNDLNDPQLFASGTLAAEYAKHIVLEVTERMALSSLPNVRETVAALRALGYRIAIDDLGAGYAGLTSFIALEPEFVKLDMSLIRGVDQCAVRQKLVRSMTNLTRDMGISAVAEGVETRAEAETLVELGCSLLQGYYFGEPVAEPQVPVVDKFDL
jgi:EAL domain-containing protein (putative c-di-GMP-specific phosphodiesterase class I)